MYVWLARLIVVFHSVVVFVLIFGIGTLIAGRFSRLSIVSRLLFVACLIGFVVSELVLHDCVLTQLENQLWSRYGYQAGYKGSFIDHYFPYLGWVIDQHGAKIIGVGIVLRAIYVWWTRTTEAHNPVD